MIDSNSTHYWLPSIVWNLISPDFFSFCSLSIHLDWVFSKLTGFQNNFGNIKDRILSNLGQWPVFLLHRWGLDSLLDIWLLDPVSSILISNTVSKYPQTCHRLPCCFSNFKLSCPWNHLLMQKPSNYYSTERRILLWQETNNFQRYSHSLPQNARVCYFAY